MCTQQVVLFGEQLDGVLHAQVELFADEGVAGLCTFQLLGGRNLLLLCAVGTEPKTFDRLVKRFLFIHQVQLAGLSL